MEVKGRDLVAGIPKTVVIDSDEIREALSEPVSAIVDAVRQVGERQIETVRAGAAEEDAWIAEDDGAQMFESYPLSGTGAERV